MVGSVHFVGEGDAAVDHDGFDVWDGAAGPDEVWRRYFEAFGACARSGLFDILAHPDLVKVWGRARPLPEMDLRAFYEPAVEAILAGGAAVELSTAGLRKPVGELYPARAFAELSATGDAVAVDILADAVLSLARGEALQRTQTHDPATTVEAYLDRREEHGDHPGR